MLKIPETKPEIKENIKVKGLFENINQPEMKFNVAFSTVYGGEHMETTLRNKVWDVLITSSGSFVNDLDSAQVLALLQTNSRFNMRDDILVVDKEADIYWRSEVIYPHLKSLFKVKKQKKFSKRNIYFTFIPRKHVKQAKENKFSAAINAKKPVKSA